MGGQGQVCGAALQRKVVQAQIFVGLVRQFDSLLGKERLVVRVAEHAPGAVVKLDAAAACGVQVADDSAVGGGDILQKLFVVRVDGVSVFAVILAVELGQQLGRGGHRLAGDAVFILELLDELVMLNKGVILAADLTTDADRTVGRFLTLEVVAVVQFDFVDASKAPHKVQVPVAAAELAIRDGVVAGALLLFDQQGDLLVFNGGQLVTGDLADLELGTGIFDGLRTQEAAHKIITERGTQCCHNTIPLYVEFCLFWLIGTV